MSQSPIRIDDLMARDVAVEWFESVALIQAVCTQILDAGKGPDGFPTAADLLLLHDGSVTIVRIPSGEDAAHAAARMVAELGSGAFPVQLRLALSEAAAGEPGTSSLRKFSDALGFFERPNRQDTLRQLYRRAALAPGKPQPQTELAAAASAKETPATPSQAPKKKKKKAPTGLLVVAAVIVAVASTSLLLLGFGGGDTRIRGAIGSVQESVREKLGLPSSSAPSEPVEKPEAPTASEARGTLAARRSRVQDAARRPPATITSGTSALPISGVPVFAGLEVAPLPRSASSGRTEAIVSDYEVVTVEAEGRVYSVIDSAVTPPRPVYPQLPSPMGSIRPDAAIVELLIGTDGLVEQVKMRTVPRTIHDIMLLSAAKAWRFDPATIHGSPVRFLYRVAIAP
jgi:hypothetical protein